MKSFEEGRKAFKSGDLGNPYPPDTNNNREWERGFNKEYFRQLEKLNESSRET